MKTLSVHELQQAIKNKADYILLDVREPHEISVCNIESSINLPMSDIMRRKDELHKDKTYVVICHHGMRSAQVGRFLEQQGFDDIYNLQGGIDAWALEIEPTMARY